MFDQLSAQSTRMHLLFVVVLIALSAGCRMTFPASWESSNAKGCDIERIWTHTISDFDTMTPAHYATCDAACRKGEGDSCVGAGLLLYAGRAIAQDEAKALSLFHEQCKANLVPGCVSLWMAMNDRRLVDERADDSTASVKLMLLCDHGERHACEAMARYHHKRIGAGLFRYFRAAEFDAAACEQGSS